MNTLTKMLLIGALGFAGTAAARDCSDLGRHYASPNTALGSLLQYPADGVNAVTLVRVQEIDARGADGRSHVLFQDERGMLTQEADLPQLITRLRPGDFPGGGAYHDLVLRLSNELYVIGRNGDWVHTRLASESRPITVKLLGSVLVTDGTVQALATGVDMNQFERPVPTCVARWDGERDDHDGD